MSLKSKLKKIGKKAIKMANPIYATKQAIKLGKKTIGMSLLAPLLPFKLAMKKKLSSDGIATKNMSFLKVVQTFHNKYVAKNKLEEINNLEDYEAFRTYDLNSLEASDSIEPATITAAVTGIIKLYKKWKDKKAAAKKAGKKPTEVMSAVDVEQATIAEKVAAESKAEVAAEKPTTQGNMKKYLIIGGIIVAVIIGILIMRRK